MTVTIDPRTRLAGNCPSCNSKSNVESEGQRFSEVASVVIDHRIVEPHRIGSAAIRSAIASNPDQQLADDLILLHEQGFAECE